MLEKPPKMPLSPVQWQQTPMAAQRLLRELWEKAGNDMSEKEEGKAKRSSSIESALIVVRTGKAREDWIKMLSLMLNYLYGLNTLVEDGVRSIAVLKDKAKEIRCIFLITDSAASQESIKALGQRGQIPCFILLPESLMFAHRDFKRLKNVYVCQQDQVVSQEGDSMRPLLDEVFERNSIGGVFDHTRASEGEVLSERIEQRLKGLKTLPALPELVLQIIRMVKDPKATAGNMEELLLSDAAIVHKVLLTVNTIEYTAVNRQSDWTLKEAIVRLGLQKIGIIGLQIKLINSFMKPSDSGFDLQRFWTHSLGCALIADRLYSQELVKIEGDLAFDDYWLAALLHDIGKVVLGFFYWGYFEQLLTHMASEQTDFRTAEAALGDMGSHEEVGRLLLLKAKVHDELVSVISHHHQPAANPGSLIFLLHLADNLSKDLGMGYGLEEKGQYDEVVLQGLEVDSAKLEELKESLGPTMEQEISELVDQYMS